jgi:hypothetical protein
MPMLGIMASALSSIPRSLGLVGYAYQSAANAVAANIYPLTASAGFGTKYTNAPWSPFVGNGTNLSSTPDFKYIASGSTNQPNSVLNWSFTSGGGWGSQLALGTDAATYRNRVTTFSDNSAYFSMSSFDPYSGVSSPRTYTYTSAGMGSKYADPAGTYGPLDGGVSTSVVFSHSGTVLISGASKDVVGTRSIFSWPWSASGYGTRMAGPPNTFFDVTHLANINYQDTYVVVSADGSSGAPYSQVYAWSNSSGFGSAISSPTVTGATASKGAGWNRAGTALGVQYNVLGPKIYAWSSAGYGTAYTTSLSGLEFSHWNVGDSIMTMGGGNAFPWSDASGVGTQFTAPSPSVPANYQAFGTIIS